MAYLLASIPYFRCLVREEYVRDLRDGHGEFLEATAVAVLSVRGDSFHFQVVFHEPLAGCAFLVPLQALVAKPCDPVPASVVQPWDCFSSDIGVHEIAALRRTPVKMVREPVTGCYRFTIASTGTDLADDPAQRKFLHVVTRDDGIIGAYPSNRLIFIDRALFGDLTEEPKFETLTHEFRAEAAQPHPDPTPASEERDGGTGIVKLPDIILTAVTKINGAYDNPDQRPDWHQDART